MDPAVKDHREWLRQRFAEGGFDGFQDYEIVELLLTYAIARSDVQPVAERLLKEFGTLGGVLDAPVSELKHIDGIGEKAAVFLSLVRNIEMRYLASDLPGKSVFDRPDKVKAHLRKLVQGRGMESFGAIFTAEYHHRHLATQIMSEGAGIPSAAYPRSLIKRALELDAKGLILFHNHPGGIPQPARFDVTLTRQIELAGKPLDLRVLDYFLIVGNDVFSFKENGWFCKLQAG